MGFAPFLASSVRSARVMFPQMWSLDFRSDHWYRWPFAKLTTSFVVPAEVSYRSVRRRRPHQRVGCRGRPSQACVRVVLLSQCFLPALTLYLVWASFYYSVMFIFYARVIRERNLATLYKQVRRRAPSHAQTAGLRGRGPASTAGRIHEIHACARPRGRTAEAVCAVCAQTEPIRWRAAEGEMACRWQMVAKYETVLPTWWQKSAKRVKVAYMLAHFTLFNCGPPRLCPSFLHRLRIRTNWRM